MDSLLRSIARGCRSLLQPTICPACGRRVERFAEPCGRCERLLAALTADPMRQRDPSGPWAPLVYEGIVRDLVHQMKYRGESSVTLLVGRAMGHRLATVWAGAPGGILVPVPLHPLRLRERGFNQSERLARIVAREIGWRVRGDLIRRVRWEGAQTGRPSQDRHRAVREAFRARRPVPSDPPVVLVDDVWTTGATATACRNTLLDSGAASPVAVLVAAITPLGLPD